MTKFFADCDDWAAHQFFELVSLVYNPMAASEASSSAM